MVSGHGICWCLLLKRQLVLNKYVHLLKQFSSSAAHHCWKLHVREREGGVNYIQAQHDANQFNVAQKENIDAQRKRCIENEAVRR